MEKPVISIVINNYNQGEFIADSIKSVLSQSGKFYIDLQIIDAASSDNSLEVIKKYEQELAKNSQVHAIDGLDYFISDKADSEFNRCLGISYRWLSEKDKGMYDGINKGLRKARGKIFAYLNADDIYLPHAFEEVATIFFRQPDTGVVYGNSLQMNKQGELTGVYPVKDVYQSSLAAENLMDQPAVFLNIDTMKQYGEFNLSIKNSGDYEYWMRLFYSKVKFVRTMAVLSASRIYSETKSSSNRKEVILETLAISKHYSGKADISKRTEFIMGSTLIGRISWLCVRIISKLRMLKLSLWKRFYVSRMKQAIEAKEKEIFQK